MPRRSWAKGMGGRVFTAGRGGKGSWRAAATLPQIGRPGGGVNFHDDGGRWEWWAGPFGSPVIGMSDDTNRDP